MDSKKQGRQKTDMEYANDLDAFILNDVPVYVVIDPSAASFKVELRNRGYRIREADNEVLDGIRMVSSLLNLNFLKVHKSCINTINELMSYVWDEKAATRGDEKPIKQNDHAMDALRYFVKTIVKKGRFMP